MKKRDYHGWNIEVNGNQAFLLGATFNTNDLMGNRDIYVCLYFGKWTVTIGKFYKFPNDYGDE